MKPLKLTLEGFTSFRSRQTVDFSTLDLFAITGQTGAGKSSLLDAITFALYGKVARLGKENRTSELVSQGATNLKVEFHFRVQQTEYKVVRTWRYRPSSPETKFILDKLLQGQWERCARTQKVEDILGMDFDTFIRVILLPQGQFDEFLKGDARKRRKLLSDLAGFQIFERMCREAGVRAKQYKDEREAVERLLADLKTPTLAEVREHQEQLSTLEQEIPHLVQVANNTQKLLDEEERLLAQLQRLSQLQQDLATLDESAVAIASRERKLQQALTANRLQGDWALVQEARNQAINTEIHLLAAAEHLTTAQAELVIQQQKLKAAKISQEEINRKLEARERDLASASAYEEQDQHHASEVARASQILKLKEQKYSNTEQELASALAIVKAAHVRLQAANDNLAQSSPGGCRLEVLNQVAPLLTQWQAIAKSTQTAGKKWEKALKQRQEAESHYASAALQLKQAEATFTETDTALKATARQNHAAALRSSLHTGDECPVCGGVYPEAHLLPPLPESTAVDITRLQESLRAAERSYHQASTALTKAEATLELLQLKESECRQDWESNEVELTPSRTQINAVLAEENWDAASLAIEHQSLMKSDAKYQEGLIELELAIAEVDKAEHALQFAQKSHAAAQEERQVARQELEHRQQKLQEVQTKLHQLTLGKPYEVLRQELQQEKIDWERQLQVADEFYQAAQKKTILAEEADKQARATAVSVGAKREQLETQWAAALQVAGFTENQFLDAQASAAEQDNWQSAISNYQQQKVEVSTRVKEATSLIGGRKTDKRAIAQRREQARSAAEKVQQVNEQRAELSAWIQVATQLQQQAEQLLTKQSTLREQEQTYHTLSRNLRSDEFQSYILEHLEAELVARATVLLRELTDARYSLIVQDGEYWVEDNWNGGETRRVRTLSGGETFAASLSMALALSEKLSMGVELGSLFLDEGFGTLDAETLDSVTQILESLRQQDRLIGVITHVRALGERLPTQVKVHKSPEGSRLVVEAM